jgi:hypothetical protein
MAVQRMELDERLAVETGHLERDRHQALLCKTLEILLRAPHVDDSEVAFREPADVGHGTSGGFSSKRISSLKAMCSSGVTCGQLADPTIDTSGPFAGVSDTLSVTAGDPSRGTVRPRSRNTFVTLESPSIRVVIRYLNVVERVARWPDGCGKESEMTPEKRKTPRLTEKRLAEALRVADQRRNRLRLRRHLRVVEPVGHHEAEVSLST